MPDGKKIEQRIEELRVKAETLMDEIKSFQREMAKLQAQIEKRRSK